MGQQVTYRIGQSCWKVPGGVPKVPAWLTDFKNIQHVMVIIEKLPEQDPFVLGFWRLNLVFLKTAERFILLRIEKLNERNEK